MGESTFMYSEAMGWDKTPALINAYHTQEDFEKTEVWYPFTSKDNVS